jgi:hypothetical protein
MNGEEKNMEAVMVELYNTVIKYSCSYILALLHYLTTHNHTSVYVCVQTDTLSLSLPCLQSGIYICFILVPNKSLLIRAAYSD